VFQNIGFIFKKTVKYYHIYFTERNGAIEIKPKINVLLPKLN